MLIFFQQLCLLLFLWILKLVDGLMEIFSAISGVTDVTYKGEKVNIIEFLAGDSTVNNISSEKILEAIEQNKEEIFSNLVQYPAYFEDRLKFLL